MVARPGFMPGSNDNPIAKRFIVVERSLRNANNRNLTNSSISNGALTVNPGGAVIINGGEQTVSGGILIPLGAAGITDANGNVLGKSDPQGGLASPEVPVSMYPLWNGLSATVPGRATIVQSSITAEQTMWLGSIETVQHPAIRVRGMFGEVAAAGTETLTFRLYVGGVVTTAVWTHPGTAGVVTEDHAADTHLLLGSHDVEVKLTAQASVTGAASIACQILGMTMIPTPAVFG